jgi:hypothetical protein
MSIEAQQKLSLHLQDIAQGIDKLLEELTGEHTLFVLFTFGSGSDGVGQYVSNGERDGVAAALRDLLKRWEETGTADGPLTGHKEH